VTTERDRLSTGDVAAGLEPVRRLFDDFLAADPLFSAQLCAYVRGDIVVDLVGGPNMSATSLTGAFSATKGAAAIALATLVDDELLDLDERVTRYWPEFGVHGKDGLTVLELLSHQGGLVNTVGGLPVDEIMRDSRGAARRLADARLLWRPGTAFGYHGVTVGVFMEELVRRITGATLQQLYEDRVRAPRDIDFFLGLPPEEEERFRAVLPMVLHGEQAEPASQSDDSLRALMLNSFNEPFDPIAGPLSSNIRGNRAAGAAGVAGVGSARGLARLYAAALGFIGEPLFRSSTLDTVSQQVVWGEDRVLEETLAFAMVFQKPAPGRLDFGSYRAFGHDGAGGALGFADPSYDLAFGYVPAAMQYPGGADSRAISLSRAIRACVQRAA
jgi:CubicO group peptidase (beta-lactamase class C family)